MMLSVAIIAVHYFQYRLTLHILLNVVYALIEFHNFAVTLSE